MNDLKSSGTNYQDLAQYSETRFQELSRLFEPYVTVTDAYGQILCRICNCLGITPTTGTQDAVVRDLMADVFDFLLESRAMILQGKLPIAYTLLRRAYESLSLMAVCSQDEQYADRWETGKEISNGEVRQRLAELPFRESAEKTRELYRFLSKAAHPNRDLVPHRFLGQGNRFVLGSIGHPDLVLVSDFAYRHLQLWYWLGALSSYEYRRPLERHDPELAQFYFDSADQAKMVGNWLVKELSSLLGETQGNTTGQTEK